MRSLRLSVFAGLLTLAVAGCRAPAPTQIAKVEYPVLGGDTNALISVYERPTMFRVVSKTSGRDIVPGIDIYVDGQCSVRRFDGTELQKRIKPSELSALLSFFDESGFFRLSALQMDSKVEAAHRLPSGGIHGHSVTDSSYIGVFARTQSKTNHIERYALDHELEWYPDIAELKLLGDVFRRVHEVVGEKRWSWK